jgi:hypothetical protein
LSFCISSRRRSAPQQTPQPPPRQKVQQQNDSNANANGEDNQIEFDDDAVPPTIVK